MKNNKMYQKFLLTYTLITILELMILCAIAWATFSSAGTGPLAYTDTGEIAINIIYHLPLLSGLGIFLAKMISLYRKRENRKTYFMYILAGICGIMLGIIIFLLDTLTVRILWNTGIYPVIRIIHKLRWVGYPYP